MQIILGCGSGVLVNAGSGSSHSLFDFPFFALGSFSSGYVLKDVAAIVNLGIHVFQHGPGLVVNLISLALVSGCLLLLHNRNFPLLEKRWLRAGVLLAVIAAVHLALIGIPWGVVYGLGLWAGKLIIFAQLDVSASSFWTAPPNASALQSPLFRDITSLTKTGLMLEAAAAASFRKTTHVPVSSISFRTGLILAVSGFFMGGAARFAFGFNVGAFYGGIGIGSLHGWAWFIAAFLGAIIGVQLRDFLQIGLKQ